MPVANVCSPTRITIHSEAVVVAELVDKKVKGIVVCFCIQQEGK